MLYVGARKPQSFVNEVAPEPHRGKGRIRSVTDNEGNTFKAAVTELLSHKPETLSGWYWQVGRFEVCDQKCTRIIADVSSAQRDQVET